MAREGKAKRRAEKDWTIRAAYGSVTLSQSLAPSLSVMINHSFSLHQQPLLCANALVAPILNRCLNRSLGNCYFLSPKPRHQPTSLLCRSFSRSALQSYCPLREVDLHLPPLRRPSPSPHRVLVCADPAVNHILGDIHTTLSDYIGENLWP